MDNPAYLITEGIHPSALSLLSIWWNGPSRLRQNINSWPDSPDIPSEIPEICPVKLVLVAAYPLRIAILVFQILLNYSLQGCSGRERTAILRAKGHQLLRAHH